MAYLKPQSPIENTDGDYIYPLTTTDQVLYNNTTVAAKLTDSILKDTLKNYVAIDSHTNLYYHGSPPITTTTDDTAVNWRKQGTGIWYYSTTGCLNGQPSQYGFLVNLVDGDYLEQIWLRATGYVPIAYRGTRTNSLSDWFNTYPMQSVTALPSSPLGNVVYLVTQ